ncbi:hypothetical protein [Polynucleobacter sp. AP-Kolm-20A-A1]|uniref:hypothetical protein n=1 Tax=Polynucleobacter sp. AP-Kolm-20A-A1 TaxID=2081041 RepID=UPI001BFE958B|nr:hypothetical protein [Polynucleobacter sp. AP-Kolm-20A-A1]QWE20918.1 hypothetical protein C2745_01625 [Polynucleobacter sp. AP-Kolm-20A-A1]
MLHRPLYRFLGRFLQRHDRRKIATKILLADNFDYAIANAQLVNSRSILFSCDVHPKNPESSIANTPYLNGIAAKLNDFEFQSINRAPSIYVPSDGIDYFVQNILLKIKIPFVLVSGDSDLPINNVSLNGSLEALLQNPLLLSWFAQNRDLDHPKLYSLPIGINLHNLWSNPLQWGGGFILPTLQELQIQTIAQNAPPIAQRIPKIFCNWHFSIDRADRKVCYEQIDHSACFFQPEPLPVDQTWVSQAQYQFVLSPHGAGLDCHRTWEALLLGCIPIVKAAKLNDLFEDLPVIAVNDWGEINAAFLKKALTSVASKSVNTEKLMMRYWKAQISKAQNIRP